MAAFLAYGGIAGYVAATQPQGAGWRLFSYHPMMMTFGMVTLFSISYVTKKKGGYLNTKVSAVWHVALRAAAFRSFALSYNSIPPHVESMGIFVLVHVRVYLPTKSLDAVFNIRRDQIQHPDSSQLIVWSIPLSVFLTCLLVAPRDDRHGWQLSGPWRHVRHLQEQGKHGQGPSYVHSWPTWCQYYDLLHLARHRRRSCPSS